MTVTLEPPVQAFFDATNAADPDAFAAAFTTDGMIDDWGRVFRGHDGIRSWDSTDNIGVQARLSPSAATWEGDEYVVTATVTSNRFNGTSDFRFRINGDRVASLTLRP